MRVKIRNIPILNNVCLHKIKVSVIFLYLIMSVFTKLKCHQSITHEFSIPAFNSWSTSLEYLPAHVGYSCLPSSVLAQSRLLQLW